VVLFCTAWQFNSLLLHDGFVDDDQPEEAYCQTLCISFGSFQANGGFSLVNIGPSSSSVCNASRCAAKMWHFKICGFYWATLYRAQIKINVSMLTAGAVAVASLDDSKVNFRPFPQPLLEDEEHSATFLFPNSPDDACVISPTPSPKPRVAPRTPDAASGQGLVRDRPPPLVMPIIAHKPPTSSPSGILSPLDRAIAVGGVSVLDMGARNKAAAAALGEPASPVSPVTTSDFVTTPSSSATRTPPAPPPKHRKPSNVKISMSQSVDGDTTDDELDTKDSEFH